MSICCCCGGKVLLSGSYTLLENKNKGVVLSLTPRVYTTIKTINANPKTLFRTRIIIKVSAPQLNNISRSFEFLYHPLYTLNPIDGKTDEEDYMERMAYHVLIALQGTLEKNLFRSKLLGGVDITVLADNEFYAHPNLDSETLKDFAPAPMMYRKDEKKLEPKKSGLGSSAALSVSLVSAFLCHFGVISQPDPGQPFSTDDSETIFRLSQLVHTLAQNRIGSGFDIAAGVYGSHIFTSGNLFVKALVNFYEDVSTPDAELERKMMAKAWKGIIISPDDEEEEEQYEFFSPPVPINFSSRLRILFGFPRNSCGSKTPSFVGAVRQWRKEADPTIVNAVWSSLCTVNNTAHHLFLLLAQNDDQLSLEGTISQLKETLHCIRTTLRELGERSNCPIEPKERTAVIDATWQIEGVVGCWIPGAGGHDALICLVDSRKLDGVEQITTLWKEAGIDVLPSVAEDNRGVFVCNEPPVV